MSPHSSDPYRSHVDDVIRRGRAVHKALRDGPGDQSAAAEAHIWQHDCEAAVAQLTGGRKTHWLARAYNEALLVRSDDGPAPDRIETEVIVGRLLAVLDRAVESLDRLHEGAEVSPASEPGIQRFGFVHDGDLRPVLEHAYVDSRRALDEGRFDEALIASCGILEAIITDALVHRKPGARNEIAAQSFAERIAGAEQAGLIRNGCARLPAAARTYRDRLNSTSGETAIDARESDARKTGQVLRTVMRDLDPGR